jgi:hypothetical protein
VLALLYIGPQAETKQPSAGSREDDEELLAPTEVRPCCRRRLEPLLQGLLERFWRRVAVARHEPFAPARREEMISASSALEVSPRRRAWTTAWWCSERDSRRDAARARIGAPWMAFAAHDGGRFGGRGRRERSSHVIRRVWSMFGAAPADPQHRPSGPPLAPQRRPNSAVARVVDSGAATTLFGRAAASLETGRTDRWRASRGVPGSVIVRDALIAGGLFWHNDVPRTSRWGVISLVPWTGSGV